jgi:hypothetical protein
MSVATTVAVAWGLSRQNFAGPATTVVGPAIVPGPPNIDATAMEFPEAGATLWIVDLFRFTDTEPSAGDLLDGTIPADIGPLLMRWSRGTANFPQPPTHVRVYAFGWPAYSLACGTPDRFDSPPEWFGLLEMPFEPFWLRLDGLPIHVMPRGFAIDTVLAAALWSLVLFGVPAARRRHRRRRGRCASCGYDLRSLTAGTTCPECGRTPVALRRAG